MDAPLPFSTRPLPSPWIAWIAGLGALLIAAASAHPYAGSWNDGSRLAAVESLGDRHTFQIDDSIFCHTPADTLARGCPPYASHNQLCLVYGTRDKLLIDGHFYSDKPPVISLLMAGLYKALRVFGLPPAAQRPDLFCWLLTFLTSGLAYVVAVLAMHRLGRLIGLPPRLHVLWLSSFALASVAVVYTRYVNNHILELALVAVIAEQLIGLSARAGQRTPVGRLALLGTLAGLGFNLDLGSGPLLVMVLAAAVVWLCRRFAAVAIFVLTAVPWVAAGVGINYAIGGVWKPMNMVPEYLTWPGSPFTPENMTGFFGHRWLDASVYLLSLLLGRRGLLLHNLPLFLLIPTLAGILRGPCPARRAGFSPGVVRRNLAALRRTVEQFRRRLLLHPLVRSVPCAGILGPRPGAARASALQPGLPGLERMGSRPGGYHVVVRAMDVREERSALPHRRLCPGQLVGCPSNGRQRRCGFGYRNQESPGRLKGAWAGCDHAEKER